ncbi:H(+)/Cl(-) exchange transporter ClcA [Marinomonas aquimarina]|uniref:H(+)/Cl(-) exchange transporter ClcA n=1 Tax=Marinomonas aquimarina TaxID=295068 RepID=A0A1A8T1Q2_9GAMM|nr:chloride channel protein [Marinomonas aquimarina]SBS24529.1 H(+)/Cl(-) exchange transporter ClcA [Marinomonas aquimarina]
MDFIARWRNRELAADDLLLLSGLALVCGVLSSLTMTGMIELLYWFSSSLLPSHSENYEELSPMVRFSLPVAACAVLTLIWMFTPARYLKVGIPYVVERLNYHQGNLPVLNAVLQFLGALIGLLGGLSIGKEGPAVHIGATFGSQLAQRFRLSYLGVDTLIACGVAGAIAAAFQTPLAGVLFAYEVIFHEYRLRLVLPVLLSAIVATAISQLILGRIEIFELETVFLPLYQLDVLAAYAVLALSIIVSSGLFYQVQRLLWRLGYLPLTLRFMFVGVLTGCAGLYLPQVMGSGYDTLNGLLSGEVILTSLIVLVLAKVLLTSISIGLGIPGGMIGPTFVIGGMLGAQVAFWFDTEIPATAELALFVLLGMAGMMATAFQAPLTAIVAMVEMTHTSVTIAPAILVIVISCTVVRLLFNQDSIFVERMNDLGLVSEWSPVQRLLRQHDVRSVANKVELFPELLQLERVRDLASSMIDYVVIQKDGEHFIVSVSEMVEKLKGLDLGPQPWLMEDQGRQAMDVLCAVSSTQVSAVDASLSLAELLSWLHRHEQHQVLVSFAQQQELWLVTSRQLDQMLMKG